MKFNVVIPSHDPHLQCYLELSMAVTWALRQLGHEVAADADARPIYFGMPLGPLPESAIVFNGEQVGPDSLWQHRRLFELYRGHTVWDYSAVNAERYKLYRLSRPQVVRPGASPVLRHRFPQLEMTHDVVFFGSSNPRREKVLAELTAEGIDVLRPRFGLYGTERDEEVAKARLCINLHFYETSVFEAVRCSYLALNDIPVLTESSEASENLLWGIASARYTDFVQSVKMALSTRGLLHVFQNQQRAACSKIQILDEVGAAVEALDKSPVTYGAPPPPTAPALSAVVSSATHEMTLCMIVKDEAAVIERCLESVRPHITRWSILDTGSTDGTQEIIRKYMADLPGQLHESSWKQFSGSRTEAIELARKECDNRGWLLLIDADEIYLPRGPIELSDEFLAYTAWVARCVGCQAWARFTYLHASRPWYFELPRHEGLYCREHAPSREYPLENSFILSTTEGARAKVDPYDRYMEDARVLEQWIVQNPSSPFLSRAQYYLAQSYRDASTGKSPTDRAASQKSIVHYLRRAELGGYEQEVFSSYLWAADGMLKCGYPWEKVQQTLLQAFNHRSIRAEPLFKIGNYYRVQGQHALAEIFLRKAASLTIPRDSFPDLDSSIYAWRAKEELAVSLTFLNGYAEARDLNRQVLACADLPAGDRARVEVNLAECLKWAPESA